MTSVLGVNTLAGDGEYSCQQCDKRTRVPIVDDTGTGITEVMTVAQKASGRVPASVDCSPKIREDNLAYIAGPYYLYTTECRDFQRKYSLTKRNLEMTSEERYFWSMKDDIQKLRDKIRLEAIKVGFDVLDLKDKNIDVTKHPYIASLLKDYKEKLEKLKTEKDRLKKKYKSSNHDRYMAYVEQGLIIDIKDESFKMTVSSIRTNVISAYMVENDEEQRKDWIIINTTKDGELLYQTVEKILDRAISDERDPMKHVDHYLNNVWLTSEVDSVLDADRCPKSKTYCRGYNKAKTLIDPPGSKMSSEEINNFKILLDKSNVRLTGKSATTLSSRDGARGVWNKKGSYYKGKEDEPFFQDYDGNLLYKQTIARSHFSDNLDVTSIVPETAKDEQMKQLFEKKFDVKNLDKDEREVLSESKSLTEHLELQTDISKWYMSPKKHRQYYEAMGDSEYSMYKDLTY